MNKPGAGGANLPGGATARTSPPVRQVGLGRINSKSEIRRPETRKKAEIRRPSRAWAAPQKKFSQHGGWNVSFRASGLKLALALNPSPLLGARLHEPPRLTISALERGRSAEQCPALAFPPTGPSNARRSGSWVASTVFSPRIGAMNRPGSPADSSLPQRGVNIGGRSESAGGSWRVGAGRVRALSG